jgi:hypothetical protein
MGNFGIKIIKISWAVQKLWPFRWAKGGRFSVFWKNGKKMTFLDQNILFSLWTVLQVSALQVKVFSRYLTTNLVVWTSRRLTHKLKKLSPKAIFNVLNSESYGLFGEPKVVDFLFFGKMKKKVTFLDQNIFFHYLIGHHAFFYCTVSSLYFKKKYYTHMKTMSQNLKLWK